MTGESNVLTKKEVYRYGHKKIVISFFEAREGHQSHAEINGDLPSGHSNYTTVETANDFAYWLIDCG